MRLDAQEYLTLAEQSGSIAFFDTEATGLNGDYNSVLVISVKPYGKRPTSFAVIKPGDDKQMLIDAVAELRKYPTLVGYYSKGFDIPMIQARLLYHGQEPFWPTYHLDLYFQLRWKLKTSRRSQGHLLSWLKLPEQKMGVPAGVWSEILHDPRRLMPTMIRRCESDTRGLEALYKKTRKLVRNVVSG